MQQQHLISHANKHSPSSGGPQHRQAKQELETDSPEDAAPADSGRVLGDDTAKGQDDDDAKGRDESAAVVGRVDPEKDGQGEDDGGVDEKLENAISLKRKACVYQSLSYYESYTYHE